jgi:hypothetical protein
MPKVDTVSDRRVGIDVPVYLDKKTMRFSAEFGDFKICDADGDKVRRAVMAAIRERAELPWTPVIEAYQSQNTISTVRYGREVPLHLRENMGLEIERFYVAQKFDKRWIRVDWDVESDQRIMRARGWDNAPKGDEIKYSTHNEYEAFTTRHSTKVLPYSDDLWTGLTGVIDGMKHIREIVKGLLGSEEGVKRLIAAGSSNVPLLSEPADK